MGSEAICLEELLSRPGVRIKPERVPRFSRPLCANYTQLDGLGYHFLYHDLLEKRDIRHVMGCMFMILGDVQSDSSFTSYTDLFERMLDGENPNDFEACRKAAKELDDWRCRDAALQSQPALPKVKKIPFDFIRKLSAELNNPSSKFDDLEVEEFADRFGDFFIELIRRQHHTVTAPHSALIERMLNGREDCEFVEDLRQLAASLDSTRALSIQACIREYWRTADENEENGGDPGTFSGMHKFLCECGLEAKRSSTQNAL